MKNARTREVKTMKVNKWEEGLAQPLTTPVFVCMRFVQAVRDVENSFLLGFSVNRKCSIPVAGITF